MPWDDRVRQRLGLRDLDILIAVAQCGGMGKAATRLRISQPSVSKAIADLESTLGVRLLDRSRRGAEPTAYGLALVRRGFAVFDELRHAVEDLDLISDPTAGEIRIGATEPIAASIVPTVINPLFQLYPRLNFYVVAGDTSVLSQMLSERKIEFAISRVSHAVTKGQSTETLFYDELAVVTGSNNPLARRRKINLSELLEEPWTLQPPDTYFGSLVNEIFRRAGLTPPRLSIATTSYPLRSELLGTGRYLTVVPGFSVRLPRKDPKLRVLPVDLPKIRHEVGIITAKGRSLSPLATLFIDRLRTAVKHLAKTPEE